MSDFDERAVGFRHGRMDAKNGFPPYPHTSWKDEYWEGYDRGHASYNKENDYASLSDIRGFVVEFIKVNTVMIKYLREDSELRKLLVDTNVMIQHELDELEKE